VNIDFSPLMAAAILFIALALAVGVFIGWALT
jgi:uncharacterized protein YneF (UPF0154 family)